MDEFEKLYGTLFPRIHGYIKLRVPSRETAEDLTQEVFIKAWKSWPRFHFGRSREAWVLGIAKHCVADYWRTQKPVYAWDPEAFESLLSSSPRYAQESDAAALLQTLIADLNDNEKRLLALRYVDELAHDKIAALCGKKPATIRQFFSRLEARLDEKFGATWRAFQD